MFTAAKFNSHIYEMMNGVARESALTNADPNTRGHTDEFVFILFNYTADL